jgi:GxxExxY protein
MGVLANDEWSHLTDRIIGAAIGVHTALGPGFQEAIYHPGLVLELQSGGYHTSSEVQVPVYYRGVLLGKHRLDLVVAGRAVVELKAVRQFDAAHFAQLRSYLAASGHPVGLLINFAGPKVECRRVYPPSARTQFMGSRASRVPTPSLGQPTSEPMPEGPRELPVAPS